MNINITKDKKVEIQMKAQFLETKEKFGENIDEKVTTPASSHIFTSNKQTQQLDEEKSYFLHLILEKLLYIMRRLIPDLEPLI